MPLRKSFLAAIALSTVSTACAQTPAPVASAPQPAVAQAPPAQASYRPEFGTMWTFDAPPIDYWRRTYNFAPDQRWLDKVRLASVRLPNCSASFVSSRGLVMTNHHCARACIESTSPSDSNYIETGFAAKAVREEKKCAGLYVDQLQSIENVTGRVRSAVTGTTPADQASQREAVIARIQDECSQQTRLTCQVVTLYHGGIYSLYRYRRFNDIRLVMAPEGEIAFFGGDPDNFTYPRYDLDVTLFRVYENDQPFNPPEYLRWSRNGAVENDLIFVVGNPGSTGRLNTIAQMEFLRDVGYPATLAGYRRNLDVYAELARRDTSAARRYQNDVFSYENSLKAVTGYRTGLLDTLQMATKREFERDFRARIAADPRLQAEYGAAWDAITAAQRELAAFSFQQRYQAFVDGFNPLTLPTGGSRLLTLAARTVRLALEESKPEAARLPAYRGTRINAIRSAVLRNVPIDTAFERLILTAQLAAARADLPPDDPFLRAALGNRTPEAVAASVVRGTRVGDSTFRASLLSGGAAGIAASTDPMIVLARTLDPVNRTVIARAAALNAIIAANAEKIGQAMFAAYGTALPPDATFTLRISDGVVKGYPMNGTIAP
ncbi:MAG TPA: S46 family peptidase, partial [Gemmatimonadaceae bacterium]|nr:S46 family peptidase [Gemmatimonadaceae bacterium]